MVQVIQLKGVEQRLYRLVAPLVMDAKVLKQNYNFPFRTSEKFDWFVALEDNKVVGFMPVEHKRSEDVINNYYVEGKKEDVLVMLLEKAVEATEENRTLSAISFLEDRDVFARMGFSEEKLWTRYVKMSKRLC